MIKENVETCVAVAFAVDIARASLERQSVIKTTCWLPFFVRRSVPKMSVATTARGPEGGNTCSERFCL